MSNGSFAVCREFELSWTIRVSDLAVDMGKIRFEKVVDPTSFVGDEDVSADEDLYRAVECSPSWKNFALPIFINEMVLQDDPWTPGDTIDNVPVYEEASFVLDVGGTTIWWGLRGCGFGSYYLRTIGGTPHLSNECMNKGTIKKVFDLIQLP